MLAIIDLIPDLLHYHLFLCHNYYFDGQISIVFNGVNGKRNLFYKMHGTDKMELLVLA